MKSPGRRYKFAPLIVLAALLGCSLPSSVPPLSAAAAQHTLDTWNPTYCKVVKFHGIYQPEDAGGNTRVAYVSLVNPKEPRQVQPVYAARFQLLTRPDGRQQWFLTSLTNHGSGLSLRQGWDNILVAVKDAPATATP